MSWERGEAPERNRRGRLPIVAGACLLAIVAVGLLVGQSSTPPPDDLPVEEATPQPSQGRQVELVEPLTQGDVQRRQLGPLLPVATGLTLSVVTWGGRMGQVDLDTGEQVQAQLFDGEGGPLQLVPTGDGDVVVLRSRWVDGVPHGTAHFVTEPGAETFPLGAALSGFRSAIPGRVWLSNTDPYYGGPAGATVLREVGAGVGVPAEVTLPAGVWVRGAVTGGLLVEAGSELLVWDPDTGTGRSLGGGRLLALNGDRIARWVCDTALTCRLEVGTVDDPDAMRLHPSEAEGLAGAVASRFTGASLSPDGTALAYLEPGITGPTVLDLASRETRRPEGSALSGSLSGFGGSTLAWSGSWLFSGTDDGGVQAWDVDTGLVVPIDLGLPEIAAFVVEQR